MQPNLFEKQGPTKDEVWHAFDAMLTHHKHFSKAKPTSCEDVVQLMLENPTKIWWWSWEFNGRANSKGGFLSHRACARASDLAIYHPELVEDRRIGRFKVYRLKLENIELINIFLKK